MKLQQVKSMSNKYGRIFTESDVEKIFEHLRENGAGQLPEFENVLSDMDEDGVRFKFPEDEPLFILRGRDKRAISAIRYYLDHQSPRAPMNHLMGIEKAYDAFSDYRIKNSGEMK